MCIRDRRYTLGRSGAEYDAIGIGTINLADATVCLPVAQTPSTPITAIYPAQKPLTSLTDIVDFNGQYGIYGGVRYKGTMPNTWTADDKSIIAVSYTHLRAHETVLDLVCRLLLEKKKNKKKKTHTIVFNYPPRHYK